MTSCALVTRKGANQVLRSTPYMSLQRTAKQGCLLCALLLIEFWKLGIPQENKSISSTNLSDHRLTCESRISIKENKIDDDIQNLASSYCLKYTLSSLQHVLQVKIHLAPIVSEYTSSNRLCLNSEQNLSPSERSTALFWFECIGFSR